MPTAKLNKLISQASEYLPQESLPLIEEAHNIAQEAGKAHLDRSLETALILTELRMNAETLAAALLVGLPESSALPAKALEKKFGKEIAALVDGFNKLDSVPWLAPDEAQAENLRKMFLAMVGDIRVIIIALANRLYIMRSLKRLPPAKRQDISRETLSIYAPLAHRLGMGELRKELADIAFRYIYPEEYKAITDLLDVNKTEWERYIMHASRVLKDEFDKAGLKAEILGRPKGISSIHAKMQNYAQQGKEFTDIHDLLALRVLVDKVSDCYNALGIIHSLWHPLPGQFDDYIANPKENHYQSLHTTVIALEGKPLEIQIRTYEMHRTNEYGVAAHWRYKEGNKKDLRHEEKLTWLRQVIEWHQELNWPATMESPQTDIFHDHVYVFTPMGQIKELPQGSTPLDFAYRIHTDLGHRCTGGKVNGKLVPLTYQLQNGDVVEIVSAKTERGPSLDWLNPDSGYVKSNHAREKIRAWFRKRERVENLDRGKSLLDKALKRLGIGKNTEEIAELFGYSDVNEFLVAIGCGDVSVNQIGPRLAAKEEAPDVDNIAQVSITAPRKSGAPTGIQVLGMGDLLTQIAPCCNPIPGDEIVGYITRSKGVTVHRKDCTNVKKIKDHRRLVDVSWGIRHPDYPVPISVLAEDRVGLLKDISTAVSESKVNIISISNVNHANGTITIYLTVDISDIGHLSKLFTNLEKVKGILNVGRMTAGTRN